MLEDHTSKIMLRIFFLDSAFNLGALVVGLSLAHLDPIGLSMISDFSNNTTKLKLGLKENELV